MKDDNLGLGAKRGSGQAEGECTGLSAFQGLLGRLNGKDEEEVDKEQKAREDIRREAIMEKRWGLIRFVKGGFLVGDKIEELIDDNTDRTRRGNETAGGSINCDRSSKGRGRGKTKKKAHEDSGDDDDRGWSAGDNPKTVQVQGEEAKTRGDEGRSRGNYDSRSSRLKTRDARKHIAKRKHKEPNAMTPIAVAQPSTISNLSPSEEGNCERKSRRLKRRARESIKRHNAREQVVESGGNQSPSLQHPFLNVTSAESGGSTSEIAPTNIPRGRHVVRHKYIQQKKKALLDIQALNEVRGLQCERLLAYADR